METRQLGDFSPLILDAVESHFLELIYGRGADGRHWRESEVAVSIVNDAVEAMEGETPTGDRLAKDQEYFAEKLHSVMVVLQKDVAAIADKLATAQEAEEAA